MALHNLLGPARPTSPVAHASNFHVSDDDGGAAANRPAPSEQPESAVASVRGVPLGKPAIALFLILAIIFFMRVIKDAGHVVTGADHTRFKELDITFWNILMVSLLAIPGINMWKFFTAQYLGPTNPFRQLVANT